MNKFKFTKATWRVYKNPSRYVKENNEPIRCPYCDSPHVLEHIQTFDAGVASEFIVTCGEIECGATIGYFAYGWYEPQLPVTFRDVVSAFMFDMSNILSLRKP